MFQGNWPCSSCGGTITELPFEPRSNSGLTCRECYFKQRDGQGGGGQGAGAGVADTGSAGEVDDREVPDFESDMAGASEPAPDSPDMNDAPMAAPAGTRPTFEGNWSCATCGGSITSLPFQPRSTENLKCIDCFKANKG